MPRLSIASSRALCAVMIGVLAMSLICVSELAIRAGEPPSKAPSAEELPARRPSPAEQKIRDALEGKSLEETGDGVLDDVLGIIKRRRSILKGSSLDPVNNDRELSGGPHSVSDMALVAEQLLKAARLLEKIDSRDQNRSDLVKRMRAEAVKLLTD